MAGESYNMNNLTVKRLMKEAAELCVPTEDYYAHPLDGNLFEWHFTFRGPENTEFAGGIYHGRITMPPDYPLKPPSIILLTPNGRFETNKKICLSISGYHPESWQPSWSIRTAILAIIGFMPTHGNGALGALDFTREKRQQLARKSLTWECPECGSIQNFVKPRFDTLEEGNSSEEEESTESSEEETEESSEELEETDSKLDNTSNSQSGNTNPNPTNHRSPTSQLQFQGRITDDEEDVSLPQMHTHEVTVSQNDSGVSLWSSVAVFVLLISIMILLLRRIYYYI